VLLLRVVVFPDSFERVVGRWSGHPVIAGQPPAQVGHFAAFAAERAEARVHIVLAAVRAQLTLGHLRILSDHAAPERNDGRLGSRLGGGART
jgi:hypothetical protein